MEPYFKYWGKTADDGCYHLLPYHCSDVAAVGWMLLDPRKPLSQRLSSKLGVSPEWLQQWFSFCLCLHDIGKFATAFQGLKPDLSENLVNKISNMPYTERHDSLGFLLWREILSVQWSDVDDPTKIALASNQIRNIEPWMRIVTGHHGIPPKDRTMRHQEFFTSFDEGAAWLYCRHVAELFLPHIKLDSLADKDFKQRLKQCSWILAGVTVLADWLGSSLNSTDYYTAYMPLEIYWRDRALPLAKRILAGAKFDSTAIAPFSGVQNLFPFINYPTPLQDWATKTEIDCKPQLFILEDVTGAGKTEAAVILVHRLLSIGAADGVYVGLPTMATANAMYSRLADAYRSLFTVDSEPSLVLAHGARHLSKQFSASVGLIETNLSEQKYTTDEDSGGAYCNVWLADSRKKALLAEVGVGTLDQALLGVLPARHQSLRLLGLSRKVLLVDEVHAYDPYMNQLLQTLLQTHAANGGSAILLSATLPQDMREAYAQAFYAGVELNAPALTEEPPYPLATQLAPDFVREEYVSPRKETDRSVAVTWLNTEKDVFELIRHKVNKGQCVCWVRNTVGDARSALNLLSDCGWIDTDRLMLFHSRFAMIDRQRIESDTLSCFGDNSAAEQRRGRVLIATQVVEQSLDLDFDVMISDLAPIDLLIQRAGREHRHIRDAFGNRLRSQGAKDQRDEPVLYVFAPEPSDEPTADWLKSVLPGTQAVYRHVGQLWLTQQVLLKSQSIAPTQNARSLIEGVYGGDAQDLIPETLRDLSWDAEGDASCKRGIANLNRLHLSRGYSRRSAEDSGGWDEDVNIPTRLSNETVSVALAVAGDNVLTPYAGNSDFPWDMSTLSLPKNDWQKIRELIPAKWQTLVEELRENEKSLKWIEVLPLIAEILPYYDKHKGWSLKKEEEK